MGEKGAVDAGEEKDEGVKYRGWKAMPYVIGNETFEKLGTLGTASNLLVYLTAVFHMRSVTATVLVNVWSGTTNIATIAGAFLSDAYFGRFATLGFACVASFLGLTAIALTAAIPGLHPGKCTGGAAAGVESACPGPTPWQLAFLMSGLGLMVVGAGGIRPCNLAFGADQFDPKTEAGKRGINSFFNWYYFTFTTAMMVSATVIVYVQSNISWAVGLAIPALLMFLACFFFFVGTPIYVRVRPAGSPFTGIVQVAVAAFKKRRLGLPQGGDPAAAALFNPPAAAGGLNTRLPHTDQFRFLDKAAIVTSEDKIDPDGRTAANPWRLCSVQQIEEVKCLVRVIPIWASFILYFICHSQQSTYVVFQALQSDRRLGKNSSSFLIPAASFTVFTMLALTLWIPVYDRILVPWARRLTGKEGGITVLQRMGAGIVLSVVSLCTAAVVEERRRSMALRHPPVGTAKNGGAISSMSSLWFIWQLVAAGVSEGFNVIGQVEFYYKQFPENMRSAAGSFLFCGMAVANYASGLLITVVHRTTGGGSGGGGGGGGGDWLAEDLNKGKLDYFYFFVAGVATINFFYFVMVARWYRYKGAAHDGGDHVADLEVAILESKSSKSSITDPPI